MLKHMYYLLFSRLTFSQTLFYSFLKCVNVLKYVHIQIFVTYICIFRRIDEYGGGWWWVKK